MLEPRRGQALLEVFHNPATAWVILFISFILTALAWHISDNAVRKRAAERFGFQSQDILSAIAGRMQEYEMVLRAGAGLFNASENVSREDWRKFSEELHLQRYFPGIQGVGFSLMVPAADKAGHVARVRAQGFPDYGIRPGGERPVYSSIVYLEPFDWRNQRAFGYDMYAEPIRRAAMERARDTGAPAVSGRVTLVQETRQDLQYGFLMYMPVYRRGMPVEAVEQRRAALEGFVYSPFRVRDLMTGILGAGQGGIDFELYDGKAPSPESLLYKHAQNKETRYRPPAGGARLEGLHDLTIAGRDWSLYVYARPGYLSAMEENQPLMVAVGGVMVDIMLFLVILSLGRQQKRAEHLAGQMTEQLARSEKRYRVLFEQAKAPMLIIDPQDGSIVDTNEAAVAFYGYERDRLVQMRVSDINMLPPAEIHREMEQARLLRKDCFHYSHRLASGDVRRVEVRAGPIELDGRELLYSIIFDITQRWRLEEAKQRQLASLRSLNEVEAIRDVPLADQLRQALDIGSRLLGLEYGIVSHILGDCYQVVAHVSPPGTLTDGQSFALGHTYCAITLGRSGVLAIDHMADSPYLGHPCYKAFKLEAYVGAKFKVDGATYGTVNFSSPRPYGRAFEDSDLEFMALLANWVGSAIERDQARQRLAESELRLKTIVEVEPECVQVLDAQGNIVQINRAGVAFCEAESPQQVEGRPLLEFVAPEFHEACRGLQARVLAGDSGRMEMEIVGLAGRRRWLEVHAVPLCNPQGDVTSVLSVARDTTERRQAEAELRTAKEAAEAASLAKSQFLATMSHEIRTPMNGILGMAQLLLMQGLEKDKVQGYARTILSSGQTLMALLNDILDLSKVEAGRLELLESAFDPEEILEEVAALFAGPAHHKGLEIGVAWKGPRPAGYRADPIRLRQMLSNLVCNAIKFSTRGRVRVEATERQRGGLWAELVFSVTDEGIGIPPDKQRLLFAPFSQVDMSRSRSYGGSGLGLSIVRSLARLMGGDVGVESEADQGARFWFSIQAKIDGALGETATGEGGPLPTPRASLTGRRVLLVEDNLVNRRVVATMLERLGLAVASAEDGREAVDLITRGDPPELVLMDCQMPVMDGYEATRYLRQWETEQGQPHLPIVALTANAFEEDRKRCLAAGMDDFMSKPVRMRELHDMLEKWLA